MELLLLWWNSLGKCPLLKSYKVGSQINTHPNVFVHISLSKEIRTWTQSHNSLTPAGIPLRLSIMLTARGYYSCLAAWDAWVQDKYTQIQEVFLHHRKTLDSLFLWLHLNTCSSFYCFPAVFSSMSASALATPYSPLPTALCHPWTKVTSANQVYVSDRLAAQLSQHISQFIRRSETSLLTLQLDGQPVTQSNETACHSGGLSVRHANSQLHGVHQLSTVPSHSPVVVTQSCSLYGVSF